MPKANLTAEKRASQFPNQGLKPVKGKLFCSFCGVNIDFEKKSTVDNHVKSVSHRRREGTQAPQMQINQCVELQNSRETVWSGLSYSFVAAGLPLHSLQHPVLRAWLSDNIKAGSEPPSDRTFRRYLVAEGEKDHTKTKEICKDHDVIVVVDETQDFKNRKVLNILIAPALMGQRFRLLKTKFVDKCNSETVVQFIIESVQSVGVPLSNVMAIISDNAAYMVAAGKLFTGLNSRCVHSTCWAHILHLVAEEIRSSLGIADKFIAKVKASLVKAPSRRMLLLDTLEKNGMPRSLPPVPVITRWTTWLETGDYHFRHFESVKEWIQTSPADSEAIKNLKKLVADDRLLLQLSEISQVYPGLSSTIKKIEQTNIPASDVMLWLETIKTILSVSPSFKSGLDKLCLYLEQKHPARSFWREIEYCDPRKSQKFQNIIGLPPALAKICKTEVLASEFAAYKSICSDFAISESFCPVRFWKAHERELPQLSAFSQKVLCIPPSSADVERSFSALNRILTPERSSLTEENLMIHLQLNFNNRSEAAVND